MGSKLESVRERVEEAKSRHREAGEMGREDVEDINNVKGILEGIPSGADDDILEAVVDVHDSAIGEASDHMEGSIKGVMDAATDIASDADAEAKEQRELSEEAADSFRDVSGSSEFGGSADGAADISEEDADSFGESSDEAIESIEDAEAEFEAQLAEIQS